MKLSSKQLAQFEKLKRDISKLDISEEIQPFLDDECYLRYLNARDFDSTKAYCLLKESLKWRQEFKPHKIEYTTVEGVCRLGSMYINNFDLFGSPLIYVKPGPYNPFPAETRLKALVYVKRTTFTSQFPLKNAKKKKKTPKVIENAISRMDKSKGVSTLTWLLDFTDYGTRAKSPDSTIVAKSSLDILQNHYPERLANLLIINAPW